MTERLSHEIALLLADPVRPDGAPRGLLDARLAASISEGLRPDSGTNDQGHDADIARLAAFLDGSLTHAERDAVLTRLADDPAAGMDATAAAAFLDAVETQSEAIPAGLAARAANILAPTRAPAPQGIDWARPLREVWNWRPATGFGLATAALLAFAVPVIVPMIQDGQEVSPAQEGLGPPVGRGLHWPAPVDVKERIDAAKGRETGGEGARSCDDSSEPAKSHPQFGNGKTSTNRVTGIAKDGSAEPGDPCAPAPSVEDSRPTTKRD
jgi:hypothetical protein